MSGLYAIRYAVPSVLVLVMSILQTGHPLGVATAGCRQHIDDVAPRFWISRSLGMIRAAYLLRESGDWFALSNHASLCTGSDPDRRSSVSGEIGQFWVAKSLNLHDRAGCEVWQL